jgi:hypothetical protein
MSRFHLYLCLPTGLILVACGTNFRNYSGRAACLVLLTILGLTTNNFRLPGELLLFILRKHLLRRSCVIFQDSLPYLNLEF